MSVDFGKSSAAKQWCGTFFIDQSPQWFLEAWQELVVAHSRLALTYGVVGRETCGTTGRKHLQIYLELESKIRFTALTNFTKEIFPGMHWEPKSKKSTRDQAREYCMKELDFAELGEWVSGARRPEAGTLADGVNLLLSGVSLWEIAQMYPLTYARHSRALTSLAMTRQQQRQAPEVCVLYGPPGVGKTRLVYDTHPFVDIYSQPPGVWFDGYLEHPVCLFDEYDGSRWNVSTLLRYTDRYPILVPVKGSFVQFRPTRIYLSSNVHPSAWHEYQSTQYAALQRRVTEVVAWREDGRYARLSPVDAAWKPFWRGPDAYSGSIGSAVPESNYSWPLFASLAAWSAE